MRKVGHKTVGSQIRNFLLYQHSQNKIETKTNNYNDINTLLIKYIY